MTFLELCVTLRERVAERGTGPASVTGRSGMDLRLVNWINAAYREIQGKWIDWRFRWYEGTITTVASTSAVALPAAIDGWFKDCFYLDGTQLPVMEWEQYRLERDSLDDMADGEPQWIVIKPDNSLLLLPAPDAVYSIRYEGYRAIQTMSGNTDVPIIPSAFHMVIVYKAMMYYGSFEDAPEIYAEGKGLFEDMMIALEASQIPGMEYRRRAVGNDLQMS